MQQQNAKRDKGLSEFYQIRNRTLSTLEQSKGFTGSSGTELSTVETPEVWYFHMEFKDLVGSHGIL